MLQLKPERWSPRLQKAWAGRYHHLHAWRKVAEERMKVLDKLVQLATRFNAELRFLPLDFDNNPLTKTWASIDEIDHELLLFAPVIFRELFPNELLIEIDDADDNRLLRKAILVKNALDLLGIGYTVGYTGRRSFHFSVLIDTDALPKEVDVQLVKQAIVRKISMFAGNIIDSIATGAFSRRMVREFFSLNTKQDKGDANQEEGRKPPTFKIPIDKLEIKRVFFPAVPSMHFNGYKVWVPDESTLELIQDEIKVDEKKIQLIKLPPRRSKHKKGGRKKIRPCIQKLIEKAQDSINLEHYKRIAIVAELYVAEYSIDEIVSVFRNQPDFDEKKTRYQVEHITAKGINAPYKPFRCATIKQLGLCVPTCKFYS
ncbi:hypothetical protein Asulf_01183 [Archaeoglobus sulfaticallidus PM70-1]|uniref:DNA primase large subunit C-terminal domain-containing protein n=1 Tax=Archaeoglobus sulfaticallidus PM70-1 TaxID=387631 RepID=N0BFW0_9EURY|nr:hypothetical protein [Archaeoglobus sulfaticallidus]AGK61182.1 hypothetical protein Asulf_01183 [Archaeoglobus sulfaticallidus PM70-1]